MRLDLDRVEGFLRRSYWASERKRQAIEASVANSICLGLYEQQMGTQVGFCRAISDEATYGIVCDVFIDEAVRGEGLGVWMVETLLNLPELQGVTLLLATADAHQLYARYGFEEVPPGRWMRRRAAG